MRRLIRRVGDLLVQLRRRKVYQATAIYLVLAVGGLEVLDILVPQTRLPGWSVTVFLAMAVVGLPVVVGLAWIYDITPSGAQRTVTKAEEESGADAAPVTASSGSGSAGSAGDRTRARELDVHTVAVLPFENLSGAVEAEPLVVGLHDDLLTELSRASALRVISGTSARAYQRKGRSASETGASLGAGTVVQGRVQMAGKRVRLNVQVVDARNDANRWADRYDRDLSLENLFDLQTELATRIRVALHAELTSDEVARQPSQPTADLDAYRLYVRGRRELEEWSEEAIRASARDFQAALERDPEYAAAWSGLADAVSLLAWYSYEPEPGAPTAAEAAERALVLDPKLAEAHVSRAIVLASPSVRDGPGALASLERAVELRPSYAYAYIWMGWVHLVLGDPAAAVEVARTAAELDPLSPAGHVFLAEAYLGSGDLEAAHREIVRGREIQPGRPLAHLLEGIILHHLDRREEALAAYARVRERLQPDGTSPTRAEALAFEAVSAVADGRSEQVAGLLQDKDVTGDPFCLGLVNAALGDVDAALEAFDRVERWEQLSTECLRYFFPGALGPVRASDRFPALLRAAEQSWAPA